MSVNPNFGVNPGHGVDAGLGTSEARAMRERLAASRAEREAAPVRHGESDLLFKIRELQLRCLKLEARNPADLLPRRYSLAPGGGGGMGAHPFKVIDASTGGVAKVRVLPGTVSGARWPTIGGVSIATEPPPTLATTETGWIVMTSTWADDHVPRSLPLSVAIVFQAGDITADYVPPAADSRTTARLVIGSVKVANGAITAATSFLSWTIVMTRVVYGNAAEHVRFDAHRL